MRRSRCVLSLVLIGMLYQGCAFIRGNYGEELGQGDITTIQKGISTRADVAAVLGAPDRIVEANGREIFHYYHYDIKSGSILVFSRTNIKSDDTFVIFDGTGIVEEVVAGKRKGPLEFQFWPFDWPFR
ncbi:MAG: outer membrane protein assembly factor BamE [Nitrospira sp.]|uniref:outer membrane protein assembly factor BamE n=1 Tax=Nitrospira cf. moscoviensis SBR1015 TaxID=96242 RepID=UPI00117E58F6|nr:outer membrane protein assembly factor BamE [Nitrospira cf. moscoviensis SBR1015]MBH0207226.1 outer membrane protein assembly factor BamE [Nitrospira sp.]